MASKKATEKSPLIAESPESPHCSATYIPARYKLAFWIFWGFVLLNSFKFQMNVTILAMTGNATTGTIQNQTSMEHSNRAETSSNDTTYELSTLSLAINESSAKLENDTSNMQYDWTSDEVNLILGSFFWGYISTLILGGWLVSKCGGKMVFGICNMVSSLLSVLLPVFAELGPTAVIVIRVLMGVLQAMVRTCEYELWMSWAPRGEVDILRGVSLSGLPVGAIFATVLNAYICKEYSWPVVFYFYGLMGVLWSLFWIIFVYDSPYQHSSISADEREYIRINRICPLSRRAKIDWFKVMKSPAFWAPTLANFAYRWLGLGMSLVIPAYLNGVLGLDVFKTGLVMSIGLILSMLTFPLSASLSAVFILRKILSVKNTRKLTTFTGLFVPALMTALMCFTQNQIFTAVCIAISIAMAEFALIGLSTNYIDIAPKFSGMLFAVGNTIATSAGFVVPAVLELISSFEEGEHSKKTWIYFFATSLGVLLMGGLVFLLFAKGESQRFKKETKKSGKK